MVIEVVHKSSYALLLLLGFLIGDAQVVVTGTLIFQSHMAFGTQFALSVLNNIFLCLTAKNPFHFDEFSLIDHFDNVRIGLWIEDKSSIRNKLDAHTFSALGW